MNTDINLTDNTDELMESMETLKAIALREVGREAEGIAKENCTAVDTGRLRNSITFATAEVYGPHDYRNNYNESYTETSNQPEKDAVYIGTNVEYAPFIELGHRVSGQKSVPPDQRSVHQGKNPHHQKSNPPLHFLKNAAGNHNDHYKKIINDIMKNNDE